MGSDSIVDVALHVPKLRQSAQSFMTLPCSALNWLSAGILGLRAVVRKTSPVPLSGDILVRAISDSSLLRDLGAAPTFLFSMTASTVVHAKRVSVLHMAMLAYAAGVPERRMPPRGVDSNGK